MFFCLSCRTISKKVRDKKFSSWLVVCAILSLFEKRLSSIPLFLFCDFFASKNETEGTEKGKKRKEKKRGGKFDPQPKKNSLLC